jgi:hypothetical protein
MTPDPAGDGRPAHGDHQPQDDHELDELVRAARASFIARSDLTFAFEAGLADVYYRANLPFATVVARRPGSGPGPLSGAVALACSHLDEFISLLDTVLLSGTRANLPGSQIQRAREVLARLRAELASGCASRAGAMAAVASAADALDHADLRLRLERGPSPGDELRGRGSAIDTAELMCMLQHHVEAAVQHVGPTGPAQPRPARVRRRDSGSPRTRRAGQA